jgi:hypothetical protein
LKVIGDFVVGSEDIFWMWGWSDGFWRELRREGVGVSWLLLEIWGGRGWKCDDGSE